MSATCSQHILDVRPMPPRERHATLFHVWGRMPEGDSLLLVNDHDPLPLYYQFAAEQTGLFRWEYLEAGPLVWRVSISKGAFESPGFVPSPRGGRGCVTVAPAEFVQPLVLDTRPLFAQGETPCSMIAKGVAQLIPGQTLVLLVPFEPVPLYTKLGRLGFSHTATELAEGGWRVEFRQKG